MHFAVAKCIWSPGCDHGHDEVSRNSRYIKIDILEAYIWISEVFRVKSGFYRGTGRLPEPPGRYMGLSGREERWPGLGRAPLPPSPNRTRRGGRRPPFPSSLPPLSPSTPNPTRKRQGVGLHLARPSWPAAPPPLLLYIRGQGGTLETQQLIV